MKRKLLALLLALVMVLSLLPAALVPDTAVAETIDQTIVEGGAILHCFDWSYKEIIDHLDEIAAAGYTAVQTSPVQPPKDYNAAWTDGGGQWWKLYQPLGFRIAGAGETWLVEDGVTLKQLCMEAHDKHIKVIVDVVANHLANTQTGGTIANLSPQVDEMFQGQESYFHDSPDFINDYSRYTITQYHMGMPDLNTGNEDVQQKVYDFLVECVDCGVDGFRFDAAKHIELPNDPVGSDFWPAILNGNDTEGEIEGIRDYAKTEKNKDLFIYGEILGGAGTDISNYTQYMAVTDNETGNSARNNAVNKNAGGLANFYYYKGTAPQNCVIWAESHDTYEDHSSDGVSNEDIIKTWAIVGARADSTSLFLARPNAIMGKASSDTTWKSKAVAEINKFKNHFKGTSEYISYHQDNGIAYIERGVNGIVVSVLKDENRTIDLQVFQLRDGTYEDQISHSQFTVSGGRIYGSVGNTGVAVIYNPEEQAIDSINYLEVGTLYLKPSDDWKSENARFAIYVFNNNKNEWVSMEPVNGEDGIYEVAVPDGKWTNVIFCRMNPGTTENNWDNKWNQTGDLYPDLGSNCYTIENGWDYPTGAWSLYRQIKTTPGYYIVGMNGDWNTINPDYQLRLFNEGENEYAIELDLPTNSQFKVKYSKDGINFTATYPDPGNNYGEDNEDNNHIIEGGNYRIYFRPNYNAIQYENGTDWYKDCIFVEKGMTVTPIVEVQEGCPEGGTITVDKTLAFKEERVHVTVTPDDGFELDGELSVTGIDNYAPVYGVDNQPITVVNNQFEMPRCDVAVRGSFRQIGPIFTKHAMVLSSEIGVKFKVEWPDDYDMSNVSVGFELGDGRTETMSFADAQKVDGQNMCYFICYINPLELAETITATMWNGDSGIGTNTYSAIAYLNSLAKIETYQSLANALHNYGYYMQQSGWTDGKNHVPITRAYEIDLSQCQDDVKNALADKALVVPEETIIFDVRFSLTLNDKTKMNIKVKPAEGVTIHSEEFTVGENGYYTYTTDPIGPLNLGKMRTFTVQTSSGEAEIKACPMTYVRMALNSNDFTSEQKVAMIAYYAYWMRVMGLANSANN